jgi:hypothetical protein
MKVHIFLVGLAMMSATGARAQNDALNACVQKEAANLAFAQAGPAEIAQAALYRCNGEISKRWAEIYKNFGSGRAARTSADYAMDRIEITLTRMAIDTVIRARITRQ